MQSTMRKKSAIERVLERSRPRSNITTHTSMKRFGTDERNKVLQDVIGEFMEMEDAAERMQEAADAMLTSIDNLSPDDEKGLLWKLETHGFIHESMLASFEEYKYKLEEWKVMMHSLEALSDRYATSLGEMEVDEWVPITGYPPQGKERNTPQEDSSGASDNTAAYMRHFNSIDLLPIRQDAAIRKEAKDAKRRFNRLKRSH